MKIIKISVYQVDLPLRESHYSWAKGKSVSSFDSTIVEIETSLGINGVGEVCPLGETYLPAFGRGVRAGLELICPALLQADPRNTTNINRIMDETLAGHPYIKSVIDMACWDLKGNYLKTPLYELLGGNQSPPITLYRAIAQLPPKQMTENVRKYKAEGYSKFQLKVGGNHRDDINRIKLIRESLSDGEVLVADANTGWLSHEALQVCNAVKDFDVFIEQPCNEYNDCLLVRRKTSLPFILDENIRGISELIGAYNDQAFDAVNIKISKFGGITKAKLARDICIELGIPMTIEDTWGSDVATSAIVHLAQSTPEEYRFSSTDFNSYNTVCTAKNAPFRSNGSIQAADRPGLGISLNYDAIGQPVRIYEI